MANIYDKLLFYIYKCRDERSDMFMQMADLKIFDANDNQYSWGSSTVTIDEYNCHPITSTDESPEKLIDDNINTKCITSNSNLTSTTPIKITIELETPIDIDTYNVYKWYTGNDEPGRDPVTWTIYGSYNNGTPEKLSEVTDVEIPDSRQALAYTGSLTYEQERIVKLEHLDVIKDYIDNEVDKIDNDYIKKIGTDYIKSVNNANWYLIGYITILDEYAQLSVEMSSDKEGYSNLSVDFSVSKSGDAITDVNIEKFVSNNSERFYLVKTTNPTRWRLYGKSVDTTGSAAIHRTIYDNEKLTFDIKMTSSSTVSGYTQVKLLTANEVKIIKKTASADLNNLSEMQRGIIYEVDSSAANTPTSTIGTDNWFVFSFDGVTGVTEDTVQVAIETKDPGNIQYRAYNGYTWTAWSEVITASNIANQNVSSATNATNAINAVVATKTAIMDLTDEDDYSEYPLENFSLGKGSTGYIITFNSDDNDKQASQIAITYPSGTGNVPKLYIRDYDTSRSTGEEWCDWERVLTLSDINNNDLVATPTKNGFMSSSDAQSVSFSYLGLKRELIYPYMNIIRFEETQTKNGVTLYNLNDSKEKFDSSGSVFIIDGTAENDIEFNLDLQSLLEEQYDSYNHAYDDFYVKLVGLADVNLVVTYGENDSITVDNRDEFTAITAYPTSAKIIIEEGTNFNKDFIYPIIVNKKLMDLIPDNNNSPWRIDETNIDEYGYFFYPSPNAKDLINLDYVKAKKGWTSANNETVTGSSIEIEDSIDTIAENVIVELEPKQDLHGYDAPWVGGAGKNKANIFAAQKFTYQASESAVTLTEDGNTIRIAVDGATYSGGMVDIQNIANGVYTLSCSWKFNSDGTGCVQVFNSNDTKIYDSYTFTTDGSINQQITISDNFARIRLFGSWGTTSGDITYSDVQFELSNQATDYEPYSNICPITGYSEVNVERVGKNKYPIMIGREYFEDNAGAMHTTDADELTITMSSALNSGVYSSYMGSELNNLSKSLNGTYTCSFDIKANKNARLMAGYQGHGEEYIDATTSWQRVHTTTVFDGIGYAYVIYNISAEDVSVNVRNFMLELGNQATTYEPYQGNTYTIDLGGTKYGGTLDVSNGVLTVDRAEVDLSSLTWEAASRNRWNAHIDGMRPFENDFVTTAISDSFVATTMAQLYSDENYIAFACSAVSDVYIRNGDSVNEPTGQLVYELATPLTIQLTPTLIKLLKGYNKITSNGVTVSLNKQQDNLMGEIKKWTNEQLNVSGDKGNLSIISNSGRLIDSKKPVLSIEQDTKDTVGWTHKNLIRFPYFYMDDDTNRGITFTVNYDGSVSFSGTPTERDSSYKQLYSTSYMLYLPAGTYILSGGNSIYGGAQIYLYDDANGATEYTGVIEGDHIGTYICTTEDTTYNWKPTNVYGYEKTFTIKSPAYYRIIARATNNSYTSSVSGKIYPMLRKASILDGTYEVYHDSVEVAHEDDIRGVNLLNVHTQKIVDGDNTYAYNADSKGYVSSTAVSDTRSWSYAKANEYLTLKAGTYKVRIYQKTARTSGYIGFCILDENDNRLLDRTNQSGWDNAIAVDQTFTLESDMKVGVEYKLGNGAFAFEIKKANIDDSMYHQHNDSAIQNQLNDQASVGVKNLLKPSYTGTITLSNGGICTFGKDGIAVISKSAVSTNDSYQKIMEITLPKGGYLLSGCNGGSATSYELILRVRNADNTNDEISAYVKDGETSKFYVPEDGRVVRLYIAFYKNGVFSDVALNPMIRMDSDPDGTFKSFAYTNRQLTEMLGGGVLAFKGVLTADTDINALTDSGIWLCKATPPTDYPNDTIATNDWTYFVQINDNFRMQLVLTSSGIFVRTYGGSPIAWFSWYKMAGTPVT